VIAGAHRGPSVPPPWLSFFLHPASVAWTHSGTTPRRCALGALLSLAHPVGACQTAIAPGIAVPFAYLLDEHTACEGVDTIPKRVMFLLQISGCRPEEGIDASVLPREDGGTQCRIEAFKHDKGRAMGTEVAPAQPRGIR